jgi:hypothetical protein
MSLINFSLFKSGIETFFISLFFQSINAVTLVMLVTNDAFTVVFYNFMSEAVHPNTV